MPPRARTILLRRPPALSLVDEPFVPRGIDLDEVDARWAALCGANPAYFDGRLCHVIGVHRNGWGGAVVHAADCAYRFWAVQDDGYDIGVRPLGVKGIAWRGGKVLLGKRAAHVAGYPGAWEFAPGGVVEPGRDPADVVAGELYEETGYRPAHTPVPLAILYDDVIRCWEIAYRITIDAGADEPPTTEYAELRWCAPDVLPPSLSPIAVRLRSLIADG
jgi:8-oxo-dGTP pyrophosphatase MutT (NUDIX family)